jgi:hypothetical protein
MQETNRARLFSPATPGAQPMTRRLLNLLTGLSLLLCAAAVALWIRSELASDVLELQSVRDSFHERTVSIRGVRGALQVERNELVVTGDSVEWDRKQDTPLWRAEPRCDAPIWTDHKLRFTDILTYPYDWPDLTPTRQAPWLAAPELHSEKIATVRYVENTFGVVIPYWLLIGVTAAWPVARWAARKVQLTRQPAYLRRSMCRA